MKKLLIVLVVVALTALFVPLPNYVTFRCGPMEDCPAAPGWELGPSIFVILTSPKVDNSPIPQKPNPPDLKTCGIQECHGPNYTCGEEVKNVCDEMYTIGEFCQQFVSCQIVEGECKTVAPNLVKCNACVEKCSLDDSPTGDTECMEQCIETIK